MQSSLPQQKAKKPKRFFHGKFSKFAHKISIASGSAYAFILSLTIIGAWAFTGHFFHYSDTWQLVINTFTTVVTFLMVFLIQNTQNRDAKAIHLKLDELIHAIKGARNQIIGLESASDDDLQEIQKQFDEIKKQLLFKSKPSASEIKTQQGKLS